MNPSQSVAIVWRGDAAAQKDATPQNNRFVRVFEALAATGIEAQPAVGTAISIVDYLRLMHHAMRGERSSEALPDNEPLVAQYLLLYSMAGSDFTGVASTALSFAPGQTSTTASVPVTGDTVFEDDEAFLVRLSSPAGAVISDDTGVATIINDDAATYLSMSDVSTSEGNTGRDIQFVLSGSFPTLGASLSRYELRHRPQVVREQTHCRQVRAIASHRRPPIAAAALIERHVRISF